MNAEEYLIAGKSEGDGFVIEIYHTGCKTWWTVFAGEGLAPRLAHMIRAARQHVCENAASPGKASGGSGIRDSQQAWRIGETIP